MKWFDGTTYDKKLDEERLKKQLWYVWAIMFFNQKTWLTLQEIKDKSGYPIQSISARLRDFRKPRFGGHDIQRRRRYSPEKGLFEYRLNLEQKK